MSSERSLPVLLQQENADLREKLDAVREQRDQSDATVEGLGETLRQQEALIETAHELAVRELVLAKHGHREGPTGTPKYARFLAALVDVLEGGDPPKPEPVEWP